MSKPLTFTIDGRTCAGTPGQTILEAALANGIYIPTLCRYDGIPSAGSCRVCTVRVGGRYMAACTQPVSEGMVIENKTADLEDMRKALVEMLFVEGNHMCPTCEKSGNCELQALAYRFQMLVPRFPFQFPFRRVEAAGPKLLVEHNRCIKCLRCVRGVKSKDGRRVFGPLHRSKRKKIGCDRELAAKLTDTDARGAMERCPVGSILRKEVGFAVPIGRRKYDAAPIGSDVEKAGGVSEAAMSKPVIATASLAGCFGCHMSILDIDERILDLIELVEFHKSPIDDIKTFGKTCDVGIIEGGCCNSENVATLRDFRAHCKVLVSLGECAIMGGLPAMRNGIPVRECLEEAYLRSATVDPADARIIPNDPELPIILDRVYPLHEIVKVDVFLPGCPPRADLIWKALLALVQGTPLEIAYDLLKFD